jgi:hypothetical protein
MIDTKAKLSEIIKNIHSIEGPSPSGGRLLATKRG